MPPFFRGVVVSGEGERDGDGDGEGEGDGDAEDDAFGEGEGPGDEKSIVSVAFLLLDLACDVGLPAEDGEREALGEGDAETVSSSSSVTFLEAGFEVFLEGFWSGKSGGDAIASLSSAGAIFFDTLPLNLSGEGEGDPDAVLASSTGSFSLTRPLPLKGNPPFPFLLPLAPFPDSEADVVSAPASTGSARDETAAILPLTDTGS